MSHVSFRRVSDSHSSCIARIVIDLIATSCVVLAVFVICIAFGGY